MKNRKKAFFIKSLKNQSFDKNIVSPFPKNISRKGTGISGSWTEKRQFEPKKRPTMVVVIFSYDSANKRTGGSIWNASQ